MYIHKIIRKKIIKRIDGKVLSLHNKITTDQKSMVRKWYGEDGETNLKHDFDLNKQSVVLDVGGYVGDWAFEMSKRYGSKIYVFEPVSKYASKIIARLKKHPNIKVYPVGLGGKERSETISIDELASSVFTKAKETEQIDIIDIVDFCRKNKIKHIDLIKMNIEGGEYELLDRMISSGLVDDISTLLIQFHNFVPHGEAKMERIQRSLSKTHRQKFQYLFVWERWDKK